MDSDYYENTNNLTGGHLCPNSKMKRDAKRQLGTFTLTNAAPQFTKSNNIDGAESNLLPRKPLKPLFRTNTFMLQQVLMKRTRQVTRHCIQIIAWQPQRSAGNQFATTEPPTKQLGHSELFERTTLDHLSLSDRITKL